MASELIVLPADLLGSLRGLIAQSRQQALRAVDNIQVLTYWQVGQHIVEFEQRGESRAAFGSRLMAQIAQQLTQEFGKGFDATNLRHMRGFYLAFPIRDAVRRELSWTHYRLLLRVQSEPTRQWYVNESSEQQLGMEMDKERAALQQTLSLQKADELDEKV